MRYGVSGAAFGRIALDAEQELRADEQPAQARSMPASKLRLRPALW